jgi:hypothetical protein
MSSIILREKLFGDGSGNQSFKKKDILFKGHFVLDLNQNQGYGYRGTSLFVCQR